MLISPERCHSGRGLAACFRWCRVGAGLKRVLRAAAIGLSGDSLGLATHLIEEVTMRWVNRTSTKPVFV